MKKNGNIKNKKEKPVEVNINNKDENNFVKIYIGYTTRVLMYFTLFIVLLIVGLVFIYKSMNFIEPEYIKYNEKSNLDYKVYLKENDFYDDDYLDKDMLYVANLIDNIKIDFRYNFLSSKQIDLDFKYNIMAKLVISNLDGKKIYYTDEYVLLDNKKLSLENNAMNIDETITINYDYYNKIANGFKTTYGVEAISKLLVYLDVSKNNDSVIIPKSEMIVNIPLSEKAIEIKLDYNEIDTVSTLINNSKIMLDDVLYMIIAVILIILSIVSFIKFLRLLLILSDNKSKYDKYIKKLLYEYDRLIVETSTSPFITNGNIININKFSELLDVRDNLKLPIMYYSIVKHHKCCFYITYEDKIYLYSVKSVDLENNK